MNAQERAAMQQALEALEKSGCVAFKGLACRCNSTCASYTAAVAIRAALAQEQADGRVVIERRDDILYMNGSEIGPGTLEIRRDGVTYRAAERVAVQQPEPAQEPVQEPKDFDHGIGADRFRVVRGAFWWHVLIGDSPTEHGKFRSRASAEKMAADLLREFRNGAFVQHEAALAEQPAEQEPVAYRYRVPVEDDHWVWNYGTWFEPVKGVELLYTAPPQRKPLTDEEIRAQADKHLRYQPQSYEASGVFDLARAIERKVREKA